jgi:hypothetical protein
MEIVIIEDLVASYRTGWVRIARTSDAERLRINDVLRKRGNGQGSEELEVEAISEGRVFLKRGHGPSPVDVHFHGTVFTVISAEGSAMTAPLTHSGFAPPTSSIDDPISQQVLASLPTPSLADRRRANLAIARAAKAAKKQGVAV